MIDIKAMEQKILNDEKAEDAGNHSMAYMLLMDTRANARRWFVIALAELVVIVGIVAGMIWYNSLPVEEVTVENGEGNANYVGNDVNGEIYNGENQSN